MKFWICKIFFSPIKLQLNEQFYCYEHGRELRSIFETTKSESIHLHVLTFASRCIVILCKKYYNYESGKFLKYNLPYSIKSSVATNK